MSTHREQHDAQDQAHRTTSVADYNPFADIPDSTTSSGTPLQQPKVTKKRPRGLSLRSQLLNKNLTKNVLGVPATETRASSTEPVIAENGAENGTDSIELTPMEEPYTSPASVFRYEPEMPRQAAEANDTDDDTSDTVPEGPFRRDAAHRRSRRRLLRKAKELHHKVLGVRQIPPSLNGRRIPLAVAQDYTEPYVVPKHGRTRLLLDERTSKPYCSNVITSSRYNVYSFFPRQLYFQFSKIANTYFMVVAIMQMIPSWSTTGTYTTIVPLLIFMSISIAREGYDDVKRHLADKEENNKTVKVLRVAEQPALYANDHLAKSATSVSALKSHVDDLDSRIGGGGRSSSSSSSSSSAERALQRAGLVEHRCEWKHVRVGDIIKLEQDDWVPADVLLLSSTGDSGEAFIETMALDGETNLKSKHPHVELHNICSDLDRFKRLRATVVSEDPNIDLYNYEGTLELPNEGSMPSRYALDSDNVIYRGSILRNTEAAIGLVVFTGEETKIRMNSIKNPRTKAPKLQRSINMIVIFMVVVVCCLAAFSTMAQRLEYDRIRAKAWYILDQDVGVAATLMGFIIMYNTLIPLSLYVTMEIIKLVQLFFLQWDIDMYHRPSNTPAEAKTATILEELGQVSYIFSDKTGTLTNNEMIFRKFTVAGVPFLHDVDVLLGGAADEAARGGGHDVVDDLALTSVTSNGLGETRYTGRPSLASLPASDSVPRTIDAAVMPPGRPSTQVSVGSRNTWKSDAHPDKVQDIRSTRELVQYLQTNQNTLFSKRAKFFLLSLALCHSCLPKRATARGGERVSESGSDAGVRNNNAVGADVDVDVDGVGDGVRDSVGDGVRNTEDADADADSDADEISYQAASPDELAIVVAARDMGYVVFDRKKENLILKTYPNGFHQPAVEEVYEILDVIEFSSARKRMSVVVRFPDGRICMFCKGADNIVLERLKQSELAQEKAQELSKETSDRKNAEAAAVLERRSVEVRQSVSSVTGYHTMPIARPSTQLSAYDDYLEDTGRPELTEIADASRRSFQMKAKKKYGIADTPDARGFESAIPSDKLVINDEYIIEKTLHHVEEFSTEGLRTLMFSYKWLEKSVYEDWAAKYRAAKTSLVDRNKNIDQVGALLESDFELLGATAIEDKLQDGVAEAIDKLRRAGIKMWMLTGDKRETAINIGYACRLIKDYSTVVILSHDEGYDVMADKLRAADFEIRAGNVAHSVIVIDGATLSEIEDDVTLMTPFIDLGVKADSVICCRASPSQKANMVLSVRELNKKKVTLAIGDGANDIAMIQSADIGIGITGKEGLQAARSSDYSIAQFRYLLKLLLVHGRYNYVRTSKFVMSTFYKELMFYLSQAIYQRQDAFTGSSLYESWSLSMFNTLFTSLPVLVIGMFEKDLKPATLLAFPELYAKGRNYESFNLTIFIYWMAVSTAQSLLVSFVSIYIYGFGALEDNTTYALCVLCFTTFVVVINTKCQVLEMKDITKLNLAGWAISVGGWFLWCCILPGIYKQSSNVIFYVKTGFFHHFGTDYTWWASLLILIIIPVMFDLFIQSVRREILPTTTDDFQLLERDPQFRKKCEIHAFQELQQSWTWPHQSALLDVEMEKMSPSRKFLYQTKSFVKKGTTHQRKRTNTLPSITELPPGSPSLVRKVSSKDSNYEVEILPSGELIKRRLNKKGKRFSIGSKLRLNSGNHGTIDEDIEDILKARMKGLEEEELEEKTATARETTR